MGTIGESSFTGRVSGLEMTASQLAMSAEAMETEGANLQWGITDYIDGVLPIRKLVALVT